MMSRIVNPFVPNQPAYSTDFVGREKEIDELEQALWQTKLGSPRHFLISGERGIGKTSFLDHIRRTARSQGSNSQNAFNFLVVDVVIESTTSKLELITKIRRGLDRELGKAKPTVEFLKKIWSVIERVEAGGFAIKEMPDSSILTDELGYSLLEIVRRSCNHGEPEAFTANSAFDGLLLLFDEVDQSATDLNLGAFFKYLLEFLRRNSCNKVLIGLAGLPSSVDVLLNSHRSSLRIFDELRLENLSESEVNELIDVCVLRLQTEGFPEFEIDAQARSAIFHYSDGHPQFVHQFGYCAVEKRQGLKVAKQAVESGAFCRSGAIETIGNVYFRDSFESLVENFSRALLRQLCEETNSIQSRDELASALETSPKELELSLQELIRRNLVAFEDTDRKIRLKYRCFAYWHVIQAITR